MGLHLVLVVIAPGAAGSLSPVAGGMARVVGHVALCLGASAATLTSEFAPTAEFFLMSGVFEPINSTERTRFSHSGRRELVTAWLARAAHADRSATI